MAFTAGQRITAGALNDLIPPSVQAVNSSFSLASAASAYTAAAYTGEASINVASMWTIGQPTRLVGPTAGTYQVHGFVVWPGALGTADGRGEFRVNGSATAAPTARLGVERGSTGNAASVASGTVVFTAAGQYVELYLNQNSGATTSLIVSMGITRVSSAIA